MPNKQFQRCPYCLERNDVSVYVHGQRASCKRCGLKFEVDREAISNDRVSRPDHAPQTEAPSSPGSPSPAGKPGAKQVPISSDQLFLTPPERPKAPPPLEPAPKAPQQAPPKADAAAVRPSIPGYDCMELLGRGGMGEVWKARQRSLNRIVAIKVLSSSLAVEPDFVRRFERESAALAALAHPHIVTIYDRGAVNNLWYFVMEFVEGRSLRDRVHEVHPSRAELLRLLSQVARAVEHAHKRGVIHRDLKPENVLIDHAGNVKVADFGLAGMSEVGRSSLTMTAVAMGTAHYMAPEQRRDAKNVDGRADIYSLGVMFYEMLCSEIPAGKFPTPKEKLPDLDARLDALIMRMLDQDPERRPGKAGEVADAIDVMLHIPAKAAPPPAPVVIRSQRAPIQSMFGQLRNAPGKQAMLVGAAFLLVIAVGVAIAHVGGATGVPLQAKIDRPSPGKATIAFGEGAAGTLLAEGDGWNARDGELVRTAQKGDPKLDTRAWVQGLTLDLDSAGVEADVDMDGQGVADAPAFAEVVFRKGAHDVTERVALTEEMIPLLLSSDPAHPTPQRIEGAHDSVTKGHRYHLVLNMQKDRASGLVDKKTTGPTSIPGMGGGGARVGFGCQVALCRFSNVKISGVSETPAVAAQR
jgi:predicted Ser/Thr protein kinase